jgi:hypothetical protein
MRAEREIVLSDRGRELRFKIREMSATQLESWIMRALLLLGPALGRLDGEDVGLGEAARALRSKGLGLLATIEYDKAKPLLDELLACCVRVDAGVSQVCTPTSVDGYVEDVRTLFQLRKEALTLNLSFFGQGLGGPSTSPERSSTGERPKSPTVRVSVT